MVTALRREAERRGSAVFKHMELAELAGRVFQGGGGVGAGVDLQAIIDTMRAESFLILKGTRLYQLLV
jgi:hypothetical protein